MDYDVSGSPSLKSKIRSSACFSCCFRSSAADADNSDRSPPSLLRSSSTWLRSKAHDLDRCRTLISRMRRSHHQHRRGSSADFRYDPLSYALNFDDGNGADDDGEVGAGEEFRYRNFSARLPASPPPPPPPPNAVSVAYG